MPRVYIAIDLKSFYASVECVSRSLDPLDTNLVVADPTRSEKTICLAVSPPLKEYGVKGRARLFEVNEIINEVNLKKRSKKGSCFKRELQRDKDLRVEFIIAPPRMGKYIEVSTKIYSIYLKYISKEDIHVYSIDEVFIDATDYLKLYKLSSVEFAKMLILNVLKETGITATAGIGPNLYLAKVAMDIDAKHIKCDENGVRIAVLDEISYRERLWAHQPLTDFWRFGKGIQDRLHKYGLKTMGDIARCYLNSDRVFPNESTLYKEFGVNAELIIDHAFGYESVTMKEIKAYRSENISISSGQVLQRGYSTEEALIVIKEMVHNITFDLIEKNLAAGGVYLSIGYDIDNVKNNYSGEVVFDHYGRSLPKSDSKSKKLGYYTSSLKELIDIFVALFEQIVKPNLLIRRFHIGLTNLKDSRYKSYQNDLFSPPDALILKEKEEKLLKASLDIKKKYGKNALLKALDLHSSATIIERNNQIGGHKA